jgi:hypothetical protein
MADTPYLIALALLEQNGRRRLPLAGKSITAAATAASDPGEDGLALALELLLRIWQRSDEGPLRRVSGDGSLLLLELPMQVMSEQLPLLKASWVNGGETQTFLSALEALTQRIWRLRWARHEPVGFLPGLADQDGSTLTPGAADV